jgi:transcription initiation factor TFIIH subunit 3
MNCVFSAQKMNVRIDCCNLYKDDSSFFQQAANITSGIYQTVDLLHQHGLIQFLLTVFLMDRVSANYLKAPSPQAVDFRPSCFCHHRKFGKTDSCVGYVCSVCLSVFCEKKPECVTCGAKFSEPITEKMKNEN